MIIFYLVYAVFLIASFLWCKKLFAEISILEKVVFWILYVFFAMTMYLIIASIFMKHGWLPQ